MNPNIQVITRTVAANGVLPINANGSYLKLVSSTGNFNFSLDGGPMQTGLTIFGIDLGRVPNVTGDIVKAAPVAPQFREVLLQDTSGAANTITMIVANYPVDYINALQTVFIQDASTTAKPDAAFTLAAGATHAVTNTNAGKKQKAVIIYNDDLAVTVDVLDTATNRIITRIPAGSPPVRIEVTSQVTVKNNTGGATTGNIYATPIFYS